MLNTLIREKRKKWEQAEKKLKVIREEIIKFASNPKEHKLKQLEKEYNDILQNDLVVSPECEVFDYKYITWQEIVNKQ